MKGRSKRGIFKLNRDITCKAKAKSFAGQAGVTLVSLLVTVVIIAALAGIVIANIADNDGILRISSAVKSEYVLTQYKEQIENIFEGVLLKAQATGNEATLDEIAEELLKEDWVAVAVADEEAKSVIVETDDGSIFQIYYDGENGKKKVEYVGEGEIGSTGEEILSKLPKLQVTYDKVNAQINVIATCSVGIEKVELIFKGETIATSNEGEVTFDVDKTGSYIVKATSTEGKSVSRYIIVTSTVTAPIIEVISEGRINNTWYGSDNVPVQVRISTENSTATNIHYYFGEDEENVTDIDGTSTTITIDTLRKNNDTCVCNRQT